ncbi:hypothetical protein GMES_2522 [Paraglaciecola mesophila KMM 241]|uniref:Uncharacterized protein n=1 Tax=Paraglaciecola mesophila KMM 241 TaxID=1128912 RepID=K6Z383_9ALTE|nr:hypothetical protein [Paraglaciecola mesophila]GAC24817.1 hypothetical protein GMES_2522 [Paraglaciecola mesophila KMM 241]
MQINSPDQVSRIYQMSDSATSVAKNLNVANTKQTTDKVTLSEAGLNAESKLQDIAAKYNPNNMSYNQLVSMGAELLENGLITSQESLALMAPPSRNFDPDEKYDTVALAKQSAAFDQSLGNTHSKDAALRAGVLEMLQTIQSLAGNSGKESSQAKEV